MKKRGQIWISVAMYTALGVILVTLILSVGMPFVNKLKARNTVLQTKNVMYDLDGVIRTVSNEGFGSKRPVFVDIGEGDFSIRDMNAVDPKNKISWKMVSEEKLGIEPNVDKECEDEGALIIKEGGLNICSEQLGQGYEINLYLDYEDEVDIRSTLKTLSGKYNLVIEHKVSVNEESYIEIRRG